MALYSIVIVFYCFFREEKLKLKKARNLHTKQAASAAEEDIYSEDDAEKSDVDLSWLPDPDKVFPQRMKVLKTLIAVKYPLQEEAVLITAVITTVKMLLTAAERRKSRGMCKILTTMNPNLRIIFCTGFKNQM
jgi:hypothetical protein